MTSNGSHTSIASPLPIHGIMKQKYIPVALPLNLRCLQPLYKAVTGYQGNILAGMNISLQNLAHAFVCVESLVDIMKEFKSIENTPALGTTTGVISSSQDDKHRKVVTEDETDQAKKVVQELQDIRHTLEKEIAKNQSEFDFEKFKIFYVRAKDDIRTDIILSMAVYYRDRGDREFSRIQDEDGHLAKRKAGQFFHSAAIFFQNLILQYHESTQRKSSSQQSADQKNAVRADEQQSYYNKLLANFHNCREKIKLCSENDHQNLILEQFLFPKNVSGPSSTPYCKINHSTIFSDYEVCDNGKVVGEGGYGSVFVVRHKKTQTEFACKKISTLNMDLKKLGRLHREIAILKQVDHPNIVKLHAVYYDSECVYLVMELCKVGDMVSFLIDRLGRPLFEREAKRLLVDMIIGIRYLHQHNIMHCDIKLENFVLNCDHNMSLDPSASSSTFKDHSLSGDSISSNGSAARNGASKIMSLKRQHSQTQVSNVISALAVKLTDFGLSKYSDEYEVPVLQGSIPYISPEVFNQEKYTKKCDIWSLGVSAFIMLTGKMPYKGNTPPEVEHSIKHDELTFPSNLSSSAIDFLRQFLSIDPTRRISLDEALVHPFLKRSETPSDLVEAFSSCESSIVADSALSLNGHSSNESNQSLKSSRSNVSIDKPMESADFVSMTDRPVEGTSAMTNDNDQYSTSSSTKSTDVEDTKEWLQIAEGLKTYWSMCKFNKLLCKAVAFSLKPAQISDLRSIFNKIDTDRNGCVSMIELKSILNEKCQDYASEIEQSEEFQALSRDGAEISYSDFIAAALIRRVCLDESQLLMTFEILDQDRVGHLSEDAIRRAIGDKMTTEEVKEMISELDKDGNGEIDYHEFLLHWRKLTIKRDKTPCYYQKLFRKAFNVFKAVNLFMNGAKSHSDQNSNRSSSNDDMDLPLSHSSATPLSLNDAEASVSSRSCVATTNDAHVSADSWKVSTESHEDPSCMWRTLSTPHHGDFYNLRRNSSAAELEMKEHFFRVASISYDDDCEDGLRAAVSPRESSLRGLKRKLSGRLRFNTEGTNLTNNRTDQPVKKVHFQIP